MTTRSARRLARTGDSLPRWHRKLERRFGIIFGAYTLPPHLRRGPLGLVFVGPIGPNAGPAVPYLEGWQDATGFEVTVLGLSLYISRES